MDSDEYLMSWLVQERLDEARKVAAHAALVPRVRSERRPFRQALGTTLVRWGHRMAGDAADGSRRPLSVASSTRS